MINGWFGTFYNMVQQALGKPGSAYFTPMRTNVPSP